MLFHQEKKVKKLYLALAAAPVPVGVITHYMRPINIAPRLVSEGSPLKIVLDPISWNSFLVAFKPCHNTAFFLWLT